MVETGSLFSVSTGSPSSRWQTTLSLQQVLEKHSIVFEEGLGELRETQARIYIDKDQQPQFILPRKVSFAIRQKVEDELDRL